MGSGINLIPATILARRREALRVRRGLLATAGYLTLLLGATVGYLSLSAPPSADASGPGAAAEAGAGAGMETAASDPAVAADRIALLERQIAAGKRELVEADRAVAGGRVLSERPDWSTLLRLVANAAGPEVLLHGFSLGTSGPTIRAGAWVTLNGVAADPGTVSSFALGLEGLKLFDRVKIVSSRREPFGDRTATVFELRCELRGAAGEGDTR